MHEFAHLLLGHLDRHTQSDPPANQALEFAADGHAAIWGIEKNFNMPQMFGRIPHRVDAAYRTFHNTPDGAILDYLLSMFFVFRLMDESSWKNEVLIRRSHPPASMRFHAACIHLDEHFGRTANIVAQNQLKRAMQKVWNMGEALFARAFEREPNFDIERRTMTEECERHWERVSDRAQGLPRTLFGLN